MNAAEIPSAGQLAGFYKGIYYQSSLTLVSSRTEPGEVCGSCHSGLPL